MLINQTLAGGSLVRISGELFAQIRAIGQFSVFTDARQGELNDALMKRIGFLHSLFKALEVNVGLRFEPGETAFVYNMQNWTAGRIGGLTDGSAQPLPSQVLESYLGSWHLQWKAHAEKNQTSRFLRAALSICQTEGFDQAITYLIDSYMMGLILDAHTLSWSLQHLVAGSQMASDDQTVLEQFFPGGVPQTTADWIKAEIELVPRDDVVSKRSDEWISLLIELAFSRIEQIADSSSYDKWFSGRWRISGLLDALFAVITRHCPEPSLPMRAALDQLEEVRADVGGSMHLTLSNRPHDRYFLAALGGMFTGLSLSIQAQDPQGWKHRVVEERFLIPRAITEPVFAERYEDVPPEWQALTSGYASALRFWLDKDDDVTWVRRPSFTFDEVHESATANASLEQAGITDPLTHNAIEHVVADPNWSPGLSRAFAEAKSLSGDERPVIPPETTFEEEKSLSDWLQNNREQIEQLSESVRRDMGLDEIESWIAKASELQESSVEAKAALWSDVVSLYPCFHFASLELGIAKDQAGDPAGALPWIEQAILAYPRDPMRWQSLEVVSKRLNRAGDAVAAMAVSKMLAHGAPGENAPGPAH